MFIQGKRYSMLRESAKNGDQDAQRLLKMQYEGNDEGFSDLLEEYFRKMEEQNAENGENAADEGTVQAESVQESAKGTWGSVAEMVQALVNDEIEAISGYDAAIIAVTSSTGMTEAKRQGMISMFQDIKKEEMEHIDKLRKLIEEK